MFNKGIIGAGIISAGLIANIGSVDINAQGKGDSFIVSTNSGRLNVRSNAGTKYKVVGKLTKGQKVAVYNMKTAGGTKWGKVKIGNKFGWCSMQYLKEIVDKGYENQIDEENKAEAKLFEEERIAQANFNKGENQNGKDVQICCDGDYIIAYEHGSNLYKPLFKIPGDANVTMYWILSNGYAFVSYENIDGNVYSGYIPSWNTDYTK